MDVGPLVAWVNEREAVRLRKAIIAAGVDSWGLEAGSLTRDVWGEHPRDYWQLGHLTDDPILQQFKFCNVRREDDRVTVWVREHIREPYADQQHLWLMLAIARTINWPPALLELIRGGAEGVSSFPNMQDFDPRCMAQVLEARRARGEKVETGAYMIRAESRKDKPWYSWSKQRYIAEIVIGHLWYMRASWKHDFEKKKLTTLERTWEIFQEYDGWGPFMAFQVIVDLAHTRYLRDAPDRSSWAALGPGSRRGLNRLYGRPVTTGLTQAQGLEEMREVQAAVNAPGVLAPWVEKIALSDIQNCLCETDKYLRVRNGEGRPRALYKPWSGW